MRFTLALLLATSLHSQTRNISLKEAIDIALRENPDLVLSRLDEQRATLAIRVAKDPFRPKVFAGSGIAYSNGMPMSVEGSAPSIFQSKGVASIFNKPLSYRAAQVTEDARTAVIDTQIKQNEIALQTATIFLDAARWAKTQDAIRGQIDSLRASEETVLARVKEGRELEIEAKRAALAIAKTRHRLDLLQREQLTAESTLATVLGAPPENNYHPVLAGPLTLTLPATADEAVNQSLAGNRELQRLESAILAKRLELRQHQSARLPSIDLVAQYALFGKFNNYEDFFRRFQRHNGQIGLSVQIPIIPSSASAAQASQAEIEIQSLRTRSLQTRNRIALATRNAHRQLQLAEESKTLARTDLEIARDQVNILLAQMEEGRATLRQLETARFEEQEKWVAWHDAQFSLDRAKLDLLKQTGALIDALRDTR